MKILVIDDAEPLRFLLGAFFESLGHDVVTLASGTEIDAALAGTDVVFTDVAMPGCSGWEVLRRVRAGCPAVPVVFMTGWDEATRKGRDGMVTDAVLDKPFSLDKVRAVLDAVVSPR